MGRAARRRRAPFKPTIASAADTSHDLDNLLPEETPPPAQPRAPSSAELAFAGYRYVRPSTTAEDILLSARTPPAHPLAAVASPAAHSFGCLTNCLAGWLGNSGDAYARHRGECVALSDIVRIHVTTAGHYWEHILEHIESECERPSRAAAQIR